MLNRLTSLFILFAIVLLATVACPLQQDLHFNRTNLFPEGLQWDPVQRRFLVSSLREGIIGAVNDQGVYVPLIQDKKLISAVGLRIDHKRRRLVVCVSDRIISVRSNPKTAGKLAAIAVYNLNDGSRLAYVEMGRGGSRFANAAAVDAQGNIYVTDSRAGLIYKINQQYKSSIFVRDARFVARGIGLNGIRFHPDGYLLVVQMESGRLYRVDIANAVISQVQLPEKLLSADGLVLDGKMWLAVIHNGGHDAKPEDRSVSILQSNDDWQSATLIRSIPLDLEFPTTGTMRDGRLYILSGRFNRINKEMQPPTHRFTIRRIDVRWR